MQDALLKRKDFALKLAAEVGEILISFFQSDGLTTEIKSDESPVTIADKKAEEHMRARISSEFSDDSILGEEFGEKVGNSDYKWIIDPIDGTQSFVCGVPLYGTLIGLERQGEVVLGIIYHPSLKEMVYAVQAQGTFWTQNFNASGNGEHINFTKVTSSGAKNLEDSVFAYSGVEYFDRYNHAKTFDCFREKCRVSRGWSDCYAITLLATGRVDLVVEPKLFPWDIAALKPVVEGAGGFFSDFKGANSIYADTAVFSASKSLHDEALNAIREVCS